MYHVEICLEDGLQRELHYARSPGAGDDSACRRRETLSARRTARQVEVGVVEEIVELRAKLDLQPLNGSAEAFVDGEICLIQRRSASRVARQSSEGRLQDVV